MSYNPNNPRPIIKSQPLLLSTYSPKQRYQITFPENSPFTKQEFKDESDINIIMSNYYNSGQIPNLMEIAPQYLDVTDYDFRSQMEYIAEAKSLFNDLPSSIRVQFQNDPAEFLDFCSKEKNRSELAAMGLLKPETEWVQTTIPGTVPETKSELKSEPSGE
ncbi:MAG: internal scaffolding protein [Microviridae sp.]|nr:MAG: internal scaffolding protein [Microviridae sp.]